MDEVKFPECDRCAFRDFEIIGCAASRIGLALDNMYRELPIIKHLFENEPPKECVWFLEEE